MAWAYFLRSGIAHPCRGVAEAGRTSRTCVGLRSAVTKIYRVGARGSTAGWCRGSPRALYGEAWGVETYALPEAGGRGAGCRQAAARRPLDRPDGEMHVSGLLADVTTKGGQAPGGQVWKIIGL